MASNAVRGLNCGVSTRPGSFRANLRIQPDEIDSVPDLQVQRSSNDLCIGLTRTTERRPAITNRFDDSTAGENIRVFGAG